MAFGANGARPGALRLWHLDSTSLGSHSTIVKTHAFQNNPSPIMMKSIFAKPLAVFCLAVAVGAGGVGVLLWRQSTPLFQATATVQVVRDETDLQQLGPLAPQGTDTAVFLQNEIELIQSDSILQKVVAQLDLNQEWGQRFNAGQSNRTAESVVRLQANLSVLPEPGVTQLHLQATSENAAEAVKLANAIAAVYCEYRLERRQRLAQEQIQAFDRPYQETAAKVQTAAALVEKARLELDPSLRELDAALLPKAEADALLPLQRELTRATMVYMAQSNQLALSRDLPANEWHALEVRVEKTRAGFTNAVATLEQAAQKQEGLRNYWQARASLEKAEALFAPYQKTVEANRRQLGPPEVAPATVTEPATTTTTLPARQAAASKACFFAGGGFLLIATMLFWQPKQSHSPSA